MPSQDPIKNIEWGKQLKIKELRTIPYWIMLSVALYKLNIEKDPLYRVPFWVIVASLQPVGTNLSLYWGYADLNRMLERDLDNDLINLQLRIRCAAGESFQWREDNAAKIQCLHQNDSRVCILPFHVIPDIGTTKSTISYTISVVIVLLPYMVAMNNQLIFGYASIDKNETLLVNVMSRK